MLMQASFAVPPGRLPIQMANSQGTAKALLKLGCFGADVIRFAAGCGVAKHSHPGQHLLFVLDGQGWLTYEMESHCLTAGMCYAVPGCVAHAITAETELTLLSIADNHIDAGSEGRLDVIAE